MVDAHRKATWDHTASILVVLAQVNQHPKRRRKWKLEDFHPYRGGDGTEQGANGTIQDLKRILKKPPKVKKNPARPDKGDL